MTATVFEAKTRLSELLKRAQAGEQVVITSCREKTPVAEIKAVAPPLQKRIGCLEGLTREAPGPFFESLPDDWTGQVADADDPIHWSKERINAVNADANEKWSRELALVHESAKR